MFRLKMRLHNFFYHSRRWGDENDYREYVLQKIFPAIRYGRDTDLERYIMLREKGQPSKEWSDFYNALCLRYTENERKKLIRVSRKNIQLFQTVFTNVLHNLYSRICHSLFKRLDDLIYVLKAIEKSQHLAKANRQNVIDLLEKMIKLCAPQLEAAAEGVDFLLDFALHYRYQAAKVKKVATLVKAYLDGTLFEEAQVKEPYHFDIQEERKRYHKTTPSLQRTFKLQIYISPEDLQKIVIDDENQNEYELAFAYFERYLASINDQEFATKIYVYSKKHNTYHRQIFDVIRKGVLYNHQKGRIFDDIFKIISGGRYIFNIRSEQEIQERLKNLGLQTSAVRIVKKADLLRARFRRIGSAPLKQKSFGELKIAKVVEIKTLEKKEEKKVKTEHLQIEEKAKEIITDLASIPEEKSKSKVGLTTTEMWQELTKNRRELRLLKRHFLEILPIKLLAATNEQINSLFSEIANAERKKELLYYVRHNYDHIIARDEERNIHKKRLEALGVSLASVYAVIMECVNEIKAKYVAGELKVKKLFKF